MDDFFLIDTELAEKEARYLASLILSGKEPEQEFARMLKVTGSASYAIRLAARASQIITLYALQEATVSVVPAVTARLKAFTDRTAMSVALAGWAEAKSGAE